jgi:hypothetical protein
MWRWGLRELFWALLAAIGIAIFVAAYFFQRMPPTPH